MSQIDLFDADFYAPDFSQSAGPTDVPSRIAGLLETLEEIAPGACDDAACALLSEFPVEAAVERFLQKIVSAAEKAGADTEEGRRAAERVRSDRLDPDAEQVLAAAFKTLREFDRMRGLLRFKQEGGRYAARCAPDHFVLPLLAEHFSERFGTTPWAVIDEKRGLVLLSEPHRVKNSARIIPVRDFAGYDAEKRLDGWEKLWQTYHQSVNNESRANPRLQKQFIPLRYRKYLTEFFT